MYVICMYVGMDGFLNEDVSIYVCLSICTELSIHTHTFWGGTCRNVADPISIVHLLDSGDGVPSSYDCLNSLLREAGEDFSNSKGALSKPAPRQ